MSNNLYEILGVEKTASQEEIKKSYRNLSKIHHPDAGGNEETFKEINNAYSILSDEEKRRNYDTGGRQGARFTNPFADMVNHFRANAHRQQSKGRTIQSTITLSLEEIYRGVKKTISFTHKVQCGDCSGSGGDSQMCDECGGQGIKVHIFETNQGRIMNQQICHKCNGSGNFISNPCNTCHGSGGVLKQDVINLDIPEGVEHGHTFVVNGGGDYLRNGIAGDFHIVILENTSPDLYREGNDLLKKINVGYVDFIIGNDYILETFDGKIKINIPPLSKNGDKLRVKSKGFNRNGVVGDMIVILNLILPTEIDDEEKELLIKIRENKKTDEPKTS